MTKILLTLLTTSIALSSCASLPPTNYLYCVYDHKAGQSKCKDAGPAQLLPNYMMDGFMCSPASDHMGYVLGCEALRRSQ